MIHWTQSKEANCADTSTYTVCTCKCQIQAEKYDEPWTNDYMTWTFEPF